MGSVIGEILPLAVGIAISPVPSIAAILMLLSPRAARTSLGFLAGWVAGILVAVIVFIVISSVLPAEDADRSTPIKAIIQIVLGVLLLVLAVRQWRGRPADGTEPPLPKWMSAIDTMTAGRALMLGFLLSAVNPKNLLMAVGAGVAIGGTPLSIGETVLVVAIFTVIAGAAVAAPVAAYLAASSRMRAPLESLRRWLVHNNTAVMAVLLLVIGVVMIGKGLGGF